MSCLDAIPAPLRLSPKRTRTPSASSRTSSNLDSRTPPPQPQAPRARCHALSRLPSQPVFSDHVDGSGQEEALLLHVATRLCGCHKSPSPSAVSSPASSPISLSPRSSLPGSSSSSSTRSLPSPRDFSSLFMKSPTFRQDLESCSCHQAVPSCPAPSLGSFEPVQGSRRSSAASACSSIYHGDFF